MSGLRQRGSRIAARGLVDNLFYSAAGRWNLYRCTRCPSAYLDPRPNEASIGKVYDVYYTHATGRAREEQRASGGLRGLKLALTHGYVNARFGTRRQPSSPLGIWVARLSPLRRQKRDAEFRFLPRPGPDQCLLDVGCGNGDYLRNAVDAGWQAVGIDADEKAVEVARQRRFEARLGGIELFAGQAACFDAITLSHVLEHLHDPAMFPRAVHRLLKSGVWCSSTRRISRVAERGAGASTGGVWKHPGTWPSSAGRR